MRHLLRAALALALVAPAFAAGPASYSADPAASKLEFTGTQAGAPFTGTFKKFTASVDFAPDALEASKLDVQIDLASEDSKDKDRDQTIKGPDLFDAAKNPTAHYLTKSIAKSGSGYTAQGALTLRGVTKDVPLTFTFTPGATPKLEGSASLKRLDFGVGQGEWKSTESAGNEVKVSFSLTLKPKGLTVPMPGPAQRFDAVTECVEQTLQQIGNQVTVALPLGIGKPNPYINELYRRARRDPGIRLQIFTALSLRTPVWHNELERRFLQPMVERLFGNTVPLDYVTDRHAGQLPPNVQVEEFFLEPGSLLTVAGAQQDYVSCNYTHVARTVAARGVNVIAQLIARREWAGGSEYSLGSNPDVTLDLLELLAPERRAGRAVMVVGEVNRNMPFMYGPAVVPGDTFDAVLEDPRYDFELFAPPKQPLGTAGYAIGLYCAALVRDGGTLQVGIGELGDAVVYGLQLRHQQNHEFRSTLQQLNAEERFAPALAAGGSATFEHGLYACTEMFVDGMLDLYRAGILRRRVYPDARLQQVLNDTPGEQVDERLLAALAAHGFGGPLNVADFELLKGVGVFRRECTLEDGCIVNADGAWSLASLGSAAARRELLNHCTGRHLKGGVLLHGGFFLGPRGFYAALRDLPESERRQFAMCGVGFINQLDGEDRALRIAQRRHGRFINSCMMMTLLGAAVSDGLADGRVVSGVGGQYNFVAMAHALPDARSILTLRATRTTGGETRSNLVFGYGHCTIPRHLRDIVVTEYGIADLRGACDRDVVAALINIADSRFQESLVREAQEAGKLPRGYRVPDVHRFNTPRALEDRLRMPRARGLFSDFPFGTDLTREEVVLARALQRLKARTARRLPRWGAALGALLPRAIPTEARPYLDRMGLSQPRSAEERLWQHLLVQELRTTV